MLSAGRRVAMDELVAKHKKQQRDLQSQITQKKKSASKKTRKSVNEECAALEQQLRSEQAQEIADLQKSLSDGNVREADIAIAQSDSSDLLASIVGTSQVDGAVQQLSISETSADDYPQVEPSAQSRKPNRQKARLARRAAEQDAVSAQAAEEAANLPDLKARERARMLEEIKKRSLVEKEVAANGHCLYLAVADQMNTLQTQPGSGHDHLPANGQEEMKYDYKQARIAAAQYISQHPDDFVPFLEDPLDEYLAKIRDTGEWGGQLELLALAKTYNITINVLQGDGRVEKIESGDARSSREAWLAYYRHGFGLGEHYNSLRAIIPSASNG